MTPEARLQSSIEMSEAIEADPRPADAVVHDWLKGKRFIGAKDRRWLTQSVYDRMRHQRRLDWWLERVKMGSYPRGRALAERILIYGIDLGELAQICSGARFGPRRLDEGERKGLERLVGQSLDHPEQPAAVKGECPDWLFPLFGSEADSELAALAKEAPLDLRVNRLKATREKAQERLFDEGIKTETTLLSPLCLRTHDRPNVAATQTFRDGWVERQDEGSQIAALLVEARPGQKVVDFCAGAGGKTLALAAEMENKGVLVASDVMDYRIERAGERLRRAGAHNVQRRALKSARDPWVKRHKATFDRVMIDAPCSGTGAWRRNPDARARLKEEDLGRVTALQAEILDSAARLVRPGGRLIYVTCSLLDQENRAQTEQFLSTHADFTRLPIAPIWSRVLGTPCPSSGDDLTLSPARHGTDGFYVCVMERKSS